MFARFLAYFGQVRLLHRTHRRLRPSGIFPTTLSRPRLTGTAMEISRFPSKRLLRMPGSTRRRGPACVSCDIDTGCVAFLLDGKHQRPELVLRRSIPRLRLSPVNRFHVCPRGHPCITRGRCGSLLLQHDGLPPSASCRSPGAPVHIIKGGSSSGVDAFGCLRSLRAHLALDGVSWVQRSSVEIAVGHRSTACHKIHAVVCSLPGASLLMGAGSGLLSRGFAGTFRPTRTLSCLAASRA